jgi:hypothetical protein
MEIAPDYATSVHSQFLKIEEKSYDAAKAKDMNCSINEFHQLSVNLEDKTLGVEVTEMKAQDYFETHGKNNIALLILKIDRLPDATAKWRCAVRLSASRDE